MANHHPSDPLREQLLYTAEQAAELLQISPSWLRKKATARAIPCTFIGKHLRFTATDLATIINAGQQTASTPPRRRSPRRTDPAA